MIRYENLLSGDEGPPVYEEDVWQGLRGSLGLVNPGLGATRHRYLEASAVYAWQLVMGLKLSQKVTELSNRELVLSLSIGLLANSAPLPPQ